MIPRIINNIPKLVEIGESPHFPDPNIPESDQQRLKSSHGDEDCCYTHCGSPGRGVPADGRGGDIDVSGGGGQRSPQVLGVCEHCPGRPPNDPANYYRAGSQPRTLNKVLLLWTAWLTLTQTDRRIYYYTIHCLLVSCAVSVRTTICWLKNKWRHSCS
ncbi:hypothetical protein NQ317_008894 [Molorchus minor]|uniref:Uncharacterized protein n=1 Tax=Molorchus minor TaxID=1323400 RepID=A0ABQ9JLK1_9CUCU|nr:hypothetical protein NQ317_008894 [Molorchus minor]